MNPIYSLKGCGVSFRENVLFSDLSFDIHEGDFLTITGPSGSGKSTLLQILLGFKAPDTGKVYFFGSSLTSKRLHELRKRVAVVFQEPTLSEETVRQVLLAPFQYKQNHDKRPTAQILITELETVGLTANYLDKEVATLSGGEKQRLALVRALLLQRPILILDEISSALDEANRDTVFSLLKSRNQTTVVVSHDRSWVEKSSRVLTLTKGGHYENS